MKKIKGVNKSTGVVLVYDSTVAASNDLGISKTNITANLKGRRSSAGGWHWSYIEEDEAKRIQEENDSIEYEYETDKHGKITSWGKNVETWLRSKFHSFRYNEFNYQCEIDGRPADDEFFMVANHQMDVDIKVSNEKKLKETVLYLCKQEKYHPMKEWFSELIWDKKPRMERFFVDFLGAEDSALNKKMTKFWFTAAIARVFEPGCMFDSALILCDPTGGTGKTKVFDKLGLGRTCKLNAADIRKSEKDTVLKMNDSFIVNFDELKGWTQSDLNNLKSFLTTTSDLQRLPYLSQAKKYERHCVFCGTTNEIAFLKDTTTACERRFWVLDCHGKVRTKLEWQEILTDEYIEQLWAEAKDRYDQVGITEDDFTKEEYKLMEENHLSHKSYKNDVSSQVRIISILNRGWSDAALKDYITFENELKSRGEGGYSRFTKIPIVWLCGAINNNNVNYVKFMLRQISGWVIKDDMFVRIEDGVIEEFID